MSGNGALLRSYGDHEGIVELQPGASSGGQPLSFSDVNRSPCDRALRMTIIKIPVELSIDSQATYGLTEHGTGGYIFTAACQEITDVWFTADNSYQLHYAHTTLCINPLLPSADNSDGLG